MVLDHWSNDAMVSMDRCGLMVILQQCQTHWSQWWPEKNTYSIAVKIVVVYGVLTLSSCRSLQNIFEEKKNILYLTCISFLGCNLLDVWFNLFAFPYNSVLSLCVGRWAIGSQVGRRMWVNAKLAVATKHQNVITLSPRLNFSPKHTKLW